MFSWHTTYPFRQYITSLSMNSSNAYLGPLTQCATNVISTGCVIQVKFCHTNPGTYHEIIRLTGLEISNFGNGDVFGAPWEAYYDLIITVRGTTTPNNCDGFTIPAGQGGGGSSGPPNPSPTPASSPSVTPTPAPTPKPMLLKATTLDVNGNLPRGTNGEVIPLIPHPIKNGDALNLPLGGLANFALVDSDGNALSAKYELINGSLNMNPQLSAEEIENGLYMDRIAMLFSEGNFTPQQELMPVHMGSQNLIITPEDPTYHTVTLKLEISKPLSIGIGEYDCTYTSGSQVLDQEYRNCDDLIVERAHASGLPPQFLKGLIYQESNRAFKKDSYRYEPKYDKNNFYNMSSNPKVKSPYKNSPLYSSLFFLAESKRPSQPQVHLRSMYKATLSNNQIGSIPDNFETSFRGISYNPLTAWNMVNADIQTGGNQNWIDDKDDPNLSTDFNFVAQTVVSSSYGLMQIMYPTAVQDMKFQLGGKGKDPMALFQPKVNIQLGVKYLRMKYSSINQLKNKDTEEVETIDDYYMILRNAFSGYNGGDAGYKSSDAINYSKKVFELGQQFWVTYQAPIFGQ